MTCSARRRGWPLVLLLLWPRGVAAQERVAIDLWPAPAGDSGLVVCGADVRGDGLLRVRLLAELADEPLVLTTPEQNRHVVVSEQLWLHAGVSYALAHRVLAYANLGWLARTRGDDALDTSARAAPLGADSGLGDLRLGARLRLLGPAGPGTKLAAAAEIAAPTGNDQAYAGEDAWRGRLLASLGENLQRLHWSVAGGLAYRPGERLPGVLPTRVGSSVELGATARVALDSGAHVLLGPELSASLGVGDGATPFDPRSTRTDLLIGLRARPFSGFELGAAFGPSLGDGAGSTAYRALAFLGWSPEAPRPPADGDDDGVADLEDICPGLRGEPSADPLMHGCPALPLDTDGDAIPDVFDACPRMPGEPSPLPRAHGCPADSDRDRDSIPDAADACPERAGVASPDPKRNGCPAPVAELVERRIVISEQVRFEHGTARLDPTSEPLLRAVLEVLKAHPEIERLEVQGHTDATGGAEHNLVLSRDRARAVVDWLVARGVAAERLVPTGFGLGRPLADNDSEAGRAKNRRVEFHVLATSQEKQP